MWKTSTWLCAVALVAGATAGCGGRQQRVTRIASDSQTDLSGKWNDTDARETSQALIKECFAAGWLARFADEEGRKPAVRVRSVVNKSDEHIDSQVFIKNIERAMVNSGKVTVLAQAGKELNAAADEQDLGASGAVSDDSAPSIGAMTGADFVITVRVSSISDRVAGERAKLYKVNLELIQSSTGEKAWIGDHEIKKLIEQDSVSW